MILLDTCSLLWLTTDQSSLSAAAIKAIAAHRNGICVSSISAFELAIKYQKKKLHLKKTPAVWFETAIALHGLTEIPVNADIFAVSVGLPQHHKDPADRILVATAKVNRLTILTPDSHIKKYKSVKVLW